MLHHLPSHIFSSSILSPFQKKTWARGGKESGGCRYRGSPDIIRSFLPVLIFFKREEKEGGRGPKWPGWGGGAEFWPHGPSLFIDNPPTPTHMPGTAQRWTLCRPYPTNIGITRATPTATPLVVVSDGVKVWIALPRLL